MSTKATRPSRAFPPLAFDPIAIRDATPADRKALNRIAQRDSARLPDGALLVAEVGSEIRAAVSVDGYGSIADPFYPTANLLALLETRADQLRSARRRTGRVVARSVAPARALPRALHQRA